MNLKVLLPHEVFLNEDVSRVIAEAENGQFCLLPNHIDFVTALVPGLLTFRKQDGEDHVMAVDEGILLKCGGTVLVSTRSATRSADLGQLQTVIRQQFEQLDERERRTRSATARLEAGMVRSFIDFDKES